MQVDTAALRGAAGRLRHEVVKQLETAQRASTGSPPPDDFCRYAGPGPFAEASHAWRAELDMIREATIQLADALEKSADDYDRADAAAASRLVAPR